MNYIKLGKSAQFGLYDLLMCGVGLFVIIFMILLTYNQYQENSYCVEAYPSSPSCNFGLWESACSYGETRDVQEGYIECCRATYQDHRRVDQCEVFEYDE